MGNTHSQTQYTICEKCFSENIKYLGCYKYNNDWGSISIEYKFKCSNNHLFILRCKDDIHEQMMEQNEKYDKIKLLESQLAKYKKLYGDIESQDTTTTVVIAQQVEPSAPPMSNDESEQTTSEQTTMNNK